MRMNKPHLQSRTHGTLLFPGRVSEIGGEPAAPLCPVISCPLPICSRCDWLKTGSNAIPKIAHGKPTTACRRCQIEAQRRYRQRKKGQRVPKRRLALNDLITDYIMKCGWSRCWMGHHDQGAYPTTTVDGKTELVARAIFQRVHGVDLPSDVYLDHHQRDRGGCGDPECVNPRHVFPTDARGNVLSGDSPAGRNARKQSCMRYHPFTAYNTLIDGKGHRQCRICYTRSLLPVRDSEDPEQLSLGLQTLETTIVCVR